MEQAVNVREAPQRHHAERDGDQRHDGAAEDVRQPSYIVGVELQGEIGHEEHLGGDRAGGGGNQRGEQPIPQRRFVIARQGLREDQRGGDRRAEHRADGARSRQDDPVHARHLRQQARSGGRYQRDIDGGDRVLRPQADAAGQADDQR